MSDKPIKVFDSKVHGRLDFGQPGVDVTAQYDSTSGKVFVTFVERETGNDHLVPFDLSPQVGEPFAGMSRLMFNRIHQLALQKQTELGVMSSSRAVKAPARTYRGGSVTVRRISRPNFKPPG